MRILPVLIIAALVLFGIKAEQLVRGVWDSGVASAFAQAKPKEAASQSKKTTEPDDKTRKAAAASDGKGAPAEKSAKTAAANPQDGGKAQAPGRAIVPGRLTRAEVEVLQQLSERREALQTRSRGLDLREKVLAATEKRIDEKISSLKTLEGRIEKLLRQHDDETERQLKSLVKVYEAMKPKDAARIFEQLEMDILLDVTERMKETKMAPVLAAMDPEKAKSLTVELATRRRLPENGG
jgi:flagellar motility protein MotE (MotC chaperone)